MWNLCWFFSSEEKKKQNKTKDVGKLVRRFYEELPATDSQGYWPEQQGLCGKSETCSGLRVQVHLRAAQSFQKGEVNTKCRRDCFCNGQRLFLIWHSFLPIQKCGSLAVEQEWCCCLGTISFTPLKCFLDWIMRHKIYLQTVALSVSLCKRWLPGCLSHNPF